MSQHINHSYNVPVTFSVGVTSLFVQVCGAVLLEASGVTELPAAVEEGLLFFLRVRRQHLLGQSEALVGLLLLAERRHHADGLSWGRRALGYVLDNF